MRSKEKMRRQGNREKSRIGRNVKWEEMKKKTTR